MTIQKTDTAIINESGIPKGTITKWKTGPFYNYRRIFYVALKTRHEFLKIFLEVKRELEDDAKQ